MRTVGGSRPAPGAASRSHGSFRVLHVTPWFPTSREPFAGVFVEELALATRDLGADVRILHVAAPNVLEPSAPDLDVGHSPRGLPVVRVRAKGDHPAARLLTGTRAAARAVRSPVLEGWRPDMVHAHTAIAGWAARAAAHQLSIPYVLTEHASLFLPADPTPVGGLRRAVARSAYRGASAVMPVSTALAEALRDLTRHTRVEVVPNTVDTQLFRPGVRRPRVPEAPVLVTAGTLVAYKGMSTLLEAVAILVKEHRALVLHIAGDGPERSRLHDQCRALGLDGQVHFHGALPKAALADLVQRSDLFVLASHFETFGVVLIEALAAGVPVVATRSGGPEEIVTPDIGVLAEASTPGSFAEAVSAALARFDGSDPDPMTERAARYSHEVVAAQILAIYQGVLRGRP